MNYFSVWSNDLGYRSITYMCHDDPMAGGPYDWTTHFNPNEYDEYCKMIRRLEAAGYAFVQPKPWTYQGEAQLVPALLPRQKGQS